MGQLDNEARLLANRAAMQGASIVENSAIR